MNISSGEKPMAHPERPRSFQKDYSRRPLAVKSGWKAVLERFTKKAAVQAAKFGVAASVIAGGVHHIDKNLGGPIGETADAVGSAAVEIATNNVIKPAVDIVAGGIEQANETVQGISREYKPTNFYTKDGIFNFSNAIFTTSKGEALDPSMPNGFDKSQIRELNGVSINDAVVQNGLWLESPAFSHYDLNGKDYLIFKAVTNYFPGEITLYVDPSKPQYRDGKVLTLTPGGKMENIIYYPEGHPIIRLGGKELSLDQINVAKPFVPKPATPQPAAAP